jgi:16S rRNA (adenine1518-N6/adenine1519-N6)-dimethyltransferase
MRSKFPKKTFAKKSFGQNFLVDENYISRIISTLNLRKNETVIEIGAGRGALTEGLIESGANVFAIELERDMLAVLREKFADAENFTLIESDALKIDYFRFQIPDSASKIKLVANLPYNISTAILQKLIEQREVFSEMILMFQLEVVERITAEVGNSERGFLSVLVQNYLETEMLFDVPPNAFRPAPKVMSAVVRLNLKTENPAGNDKLFRKIISAAFFQKRKTIYNNLRNFSLENLPSIDWLKIFELTGIAQNRRAETLTLEEWQSLCKMLENQTK